MPDFLLADAPGSSMHDAFRTRSHDSRTIGTVVRDMSVHINIVYDSIYANNESIYLADLQAARSYIRQHESDRHSLNPPIGVVHYTPPLHTRPIIYSGQPFPYDVANLQETTSVQEFAIDYLFWQAVGDYQEWLESTVVTRQSGMAGSFEWDAAIFSWFDYIRSQFPPEPRVRFNAQGSNGQWLR
jgi:hypothetical protein